MTIRVTERQARELGLFDDQLPAKVHRRAPRKPRKRLTKKERAALPENQVESAVIDFLKLRQWQVVRNHVGTFIPAGSIMRLIESGQPLTKETIFRQMVRIGKKGEPDWVASRPRGSGGMDMFYLEVKGKGKKPNPEQVAVMEELRLTGAEVTWVDDFEFGPHGFLPWYLRKYGSA